MDNKSTNQPKTHHPISLDQRTDKWPDGRMDRQKDVAVPHVGVVNMNRLF